MVCSSTLRAKPVTHSTKRCWPRWVKPTAIGNRMACQSDHSGVTFIAHLLEGWFVGGHNRQAPSRRCACQSTRMQDNGERHCQTLDFTRNYWLECPLSLYRGLGFMAVRESRWLIDQGSAHLLFLTRSLLGSRHRPAEQRSRRGFSDHR